jgi:chromosome segregation ATPase
MYNLDITNIAGIRRGEAELEPGVNAIQASNWQGKSSLVAAIQTVMGTGTPLTEGEDAGRVELSTEGDAYRVELHREQGIVRREGDPYLTDEQDVACAELFAFLDESNEIRQAVRNGDDLKPLLTRPLDLENIEKQIRDRRQERERIDRELEEAERTANRQDTLQQRVTQLESELEELRVEREALDDPGEEEDQREELNETRTEHERVKRTVEQTETQIERIEDQLEEKRSELSSIEVPETTDVGDSLAEKRERHDDLQSEVDLLESIYNVNRQIIEEDKLGMVTDIERGLSGDSVACWVCGQEADREGVEERLESISSAVSERRETLATLQSDITDLKKRQRNHREAEQRQSQLESSIDDLEHRRNEKRADLNTARERLEELETELETLEDSVQATDERADELDTEITRLEVQLEDAREELEEAEKASETVTQLEAQREEIADEITNLRERKEAVVSELLDSFEDAIETVIERLEPSFETARLVNRDDEFELVIARDGREVQVDALSEGEVELLGFIVALAGYSTYEVDERVPVMVIDSVGGLAGEHLRPLVAYLESAAPVVVTTAYPEQGDVGETVISPAEWTVVSD